MEENHYGAISSPNPITRGAAVDIDAPPLKAALSHLPITCWPT